MKSRQRTGQTSAEKARTEAIAKVARQVRDLIEMLRRESAADSEIHMLFTTQRYGGLGLDSREAQAFRRCLDSIVALFGRNTKTRALSRKASQDLLQKTVLRAIRPLRDEKADERQRFERRLTRELRAFRRELSQEPELWQMTVAVNGLVGRALPLKLGSVEFVRGSTTTASELTKKISLASAHGRRSAEVLSSLFSTGTLARTEIAALDKTAARDLGLAQIEETIDVLNFFGGFFARRSEPSRAYLAPDGDRRRIAWAVTRPNIANITFNDGIGKPDQPIRRFLLRSREAKRLGVARANELLAETDRTAFEERLVSALAWAGRARVASRVDTAFLYYAIALEALLTKRDTRTGVTNRLRLRAAFVLGKTAEVRKRLSKLVDGLYRLRSELVHGGNARVLSDDDLALMRGLVERTIVTVLCD